jgi:hypothetical protein
MVNVVPASADTFAESEAAGRTAAVFWLTWRSFGATLFSMPKEGVSTYAPGVTLPSWFA